MIERFKKVIYKVVGFIILLLTYYLLNLFFNISIKCPIYEFTHLYCPGCGITRCLFALIQLDFYKAFKYNQLVFILLPISFIYYIIYSYYYIKYNKRITIPKYISITILIIVLLFGILRNINYFSFIRP